MVTNTVRNFTLLLSVLIVNFQLIAQPIDTALTFFPMHAGDKWKYQVNLAPSNAKYASTTEIMGDTVLPNGLRYWVFKNTSNLYNINTTEFSWMRLDSVSGSVYRRDTLNHETQEDSLRAKPGDSFTSQYGDPRFYSDITIGIVLGLRTTIKDCHGFVYDSEHELALGLGPVFYFEGYGDGIYSTSRSLTYAKINGIEYGTPSLVSNTKTYPSVYMLRQSYPNPFNPITTISFSLPLKSFISLKIFDLLGREVATIVSEQLSAGNHAIKWNAVNMSSGIYFYRLQAGSFTETKKLVLLR